jgi:hypothetical protein
MESSNSCPGAGAGTTNPEPGNRRGSPTPSADRDFAPIDTTIPTEILIDDLSSLTFSHRGSIMFGGKRAFALVPDAAQQMDEALLNQDAVATANSNTNAGAGGDAPVETPDAPLQVPETSKTGSVPSIQVVPLDVEKESQKVRSLYESGEAADRTEEGRASAVGTPSDRVDEVAAREEGGVAYGFLCQRCCMNDSY